MRLFFGCLALLLTLSFAGCCGLGACGALYWALTNDPVVPSVCPGPDCQPPVTPPVTPTPTPEPDKPKNPRKPWGPREDSPVGRVSNVVEQLHMPAVIGQRDGSVHEGHAVQVDLPCDQLVRNCGGSNGEGLCVFTAIMFGARLQNVPQLKDFQAWMKKHPGGGWPRKVDEMIATICREKNMPVPDYIQVENGDWSIIELALKTGRMPAITYGAAHMVNIVCLDDKYGAFRDNNFVGPNEIDWMTTAQAKQKAGGNRFWAVILLAPRPPMPPKNGTPVICSAPYLPGEYHWTKVADSLQWALWRDGGQIGSYDAGEDFYAVRKAPGEWGPYYRRPPVDLPPEAFPALAGRVPGGVFFKYEGAPRYSRCGVVISEEEARSALTLADDTNKLSLTVIGTQAEQDKVRAAVVAEKDFAGRVVFQGYSPDDWAVSTEKFGFAHDGKPTIYLQKPDGEVLLHLRDFDAGTIQQLRQKHPDYKPENDPGMPHAPLAVGDIGAVPIVVCVFCLLLFCFAAFALITSGAAFFGHLVGEFIEP